MTYNNLNRESYHDYISRRLREENFGDQKTIDQRDNEIFELKQRISRLEEQVGSLLNHHE